MINKITFITGNPAKAEQLSWHLNYPISHQKLDLTEIQSLDLKEVVEHKAKEAYQKIKCPVLVEDVSLTFNSLGKLPGPFIKWFLIVLDNKGLCRILDNFEDRSALAEVCFGLYDGKYLHIFDGKMKGVIADKPRGKKGFGWDPIFIPEGSKKTWAEMFPEEQKNISMRRQALKKLENFLNG